MIDRDDVHEVYAEWRTVFNSHDPHRTAVAEAWVDNGRVPLDAGEAVTNFGSEPFALDRDDALISSGDLREGALPGESTVWFGPDGGR